MNLSSIPMAVNVRFTKDWTSPNDFGSNGHFELTIPAGATAVAWRETLYGMGDSIFLCFDKHIADLDDYDNTLIEYGMTEDDGHAKLLACLEIVPERAQYQEPRPAADESQIPRDWLECDGGAVMDDAERQHAALLVSAARCAS
jgi:hypothetical protein